MPGKRILLVDYDSSSLSHTRKVLESAGFNVSTCADGLTAIDQFKSLSPDLVLLSAMLPKMHGFEVCSNIRKLPGGEKTPVVIITDVYKGKRYKLDAINKYGATEYIEKPIEDSNLVNILNELVRTNGQEPQINPTEPDSDMTVQLSRDMLKQMAPQPPEVVKTPAEKKVTAEKHTHGNDIQKKLEDSLAGLDVIKKGKPKTKITATVPSDPLRASPVQIVPQPAAPSDGEKFTSEDLFQDIIASVEEELESEKQGTKFTVSSGTDSTSRPTLMVKEDSKKSAFDPALQRKISSTLGGIWKDKPKAEKGPGSAKSGASTAAVSELPPVEQAPSPESVIPQQPLGETGETDRPTVQEITPQGIHFGQYLLLRKIATGGMAELFKAKRKGVEGFEKILVIKRLLPHMSDNDEFVTMFIDEAKLAAQLTHQNVCQIFDLGKIDNSYYIAMEHIHGKDLKAVLQTCRVKDRPLPVELAILIASKMCSALDYAHRKRDGKGRPLHLVHRDVSPQNILLSYEGEVKLVDFGIAKAATKVHVTQHGALKGKVLYMSPEQASARSVDNRSDIFSLGIVLYEMLTGKPLFFEDNDTEVSILDKVREARVVPVQEIIANLPPNLEKIIEKALKKNPDERYQAANEMQRELDNLFYTEGYNTTTGSLANFIRSLFPEEWGHETGVRETTIIEKEAIGASQVPRVTDVSQEASQQPAEIEGPGVVAKQASSEELLTVPTEEKRIEPPSPQRSEPKSARIKPLDEETPGKFRDIAMPQILLQPEKRNVPLFAILIGILILAVAIVSYLLFRPQRGQQSPKALEQEKKSVQVPSTGSAQQPANPVMAQNAMPVITEPAAAPAVDAAKQKELEQEKLKEQAAVQEKQKLEEQKLKEQAAAEEKKKLEEKQRQEEAKQEEARLEEEQKAAASQEEQNGLESVLAPAAEQEATQIAEAQGTPSLEAQSPPQTPVTETPQEQAKVEDPVSSEPPVQHGDLVELTPDVVKPVILARVDPAYPPAARARKMEGTVILSVLISENGKVTEAKILRHAGGATGLDEAAIAAVKRWKFRPAVKQGKRVKVWMTLPIVFKLQ